MIWAPDGSKGLPVSPNTKALLFHRVQSFVAVHRPLLLVPPSLPRLDGTGWRAAAIGRAMRFCLLGFAPKGVQARGVRGGIGGAVGIFRWRLLRIRREWNSRVSCLYVYMENGKSSK